MYVCFKCVYVKSCGKNSPKDHQIQPLQNQPAFIAACRDCGCPGHGAFDRDCRGHDSFARARDCRAPGLWSGTAPRVDD